MQKQITFEAQLLKVFIQTAKDDPSKQYPKIVLYHDDFSQRSPTLGVRIDDYIALGLDKPENVKKLVLADKCVFICDLNFWENNPILSVVKIIPKTNG